MRWGGDAKIALADPGLLGSLLFDKIPDKRYSLGIIPHYIHLNNNIIQQLQKTYPNSIIINVLDEPLKVLNTIAQCECVISTSLHGLILADSFNIPNQWIYISELGGNKFKFDDYYSSFDLSCERVDLNFDKVPALEDIKSRYKISEKMILRKQNELIESFPFISDNYLSFRQNSVFKDSIPSNNYIIHFSNKMLCIEDNRIILSNFTKYKNGIEIVFMPKKSIYMKYNGSFIDNISEDGEVKLSQKPHLFSYRLNQDRSISILIGNLFIGFDTDSKIAFKSEISNSERFMIYESNNIIEFQ